MNRPQNIKTFGGPLRSTRRKLSRPDRFHGIKGSGGGDKITNKTPINHVWSQGVERLSNGSINVGWWNHELFLGVHPKFTLTGPVTLNVDKEYLQKDSPWVYGPKTSGLKGVNTLGDRRHVANTRDSDEYRENSIIGGDLWIDALQRLAQKTSPLWAEACQIAPGPGLGHQVNAEERVCALRAGQRRVVCQAQIGLEPVELAHGGTPSRECSGVRWPVNHGSAVTQ